MARLLNRRLHLFIVVVWVLICSTVGFAFCTSGFSAPVSTKETATLSTKEKQALVQQAVAYYEQGESAKAQESLERAQSVFPENYAVPYYLGLIYLEQGKRAAAIAQWRRYVKIAPKSENALKIRKYLTILFREQAREFAKQAVAAEATLTSGQADDKTVAVTTFKNLGSNQLGPLGKGMAAMLISDLSQVPDLQVVERIKLQALLEEMKLGTSGLVNKNTAPRVGKLLKAKHLTTGSLSDLESLNLMIASVVMDTDKQVVSGTQQAQGELIQFYDLEKQIACQIIEDLGKDCSAVPAEFNKVHTRSMPALVSYSRGLEYFDQEKYDQARSMFQQALDEDPQFELAEKALLATPTLAIILMNTSQIISGVKASGPSNTVAGSSTSSTGTAGAGGTVGFSPTTAIIAGAAVIGGGAALAGGGGGGDGGSDSPQPANTDPNGDWSGTWTDDTDGSSGNVTLTLTIDGTTVSGTVSAPGDECLPAGNVSGTISGNRLNLTVYSSTERIDVDCTIDETTMTMTGTYYHSDSALGCQGDEGYISMSLTGGANIHW